MKRHAFSSISSMLALTLLTAALSSCTGNDDSGSEEEPAIGEIQVVTDPSSIALPLDAYMLSPEEYINVQRAAWQLVRDCVERFGGAYSLTEQDFIASLGVADLESTHQRRYGLVDAESASLYGYNLPPEQRPSEDDRTGWDPSDTELLLVRGTASGVAQDPPEDVDGDPLPEDGCQGEATRAGTEGITEPADVRLPNDLSVESHDRAENDSRVREAMDAWSECMAESGYSYDTIWDPNDTEWPEPAAQEEIATAQADVSCKLDGNLIGIWATVEAAYQERMIEDHAEELEAIGEYNRGIASRAADIVAGG